MAPTSYRWEHSLGEHGTEALLALCDARSRELKREALTEQARRAILHATTGPLHLLGEVGTQLVSYAQARPSAGTLELELLGDEVEAGLLGLASTLAVGRGERLEIWLHAMRGELRAPVAGFAATRILHRLTRRLPASPPGPVPPGIELRGYDHRRDPETWLKVNARAFATHPDQGRMTRADLDEAVEFLWWN